jgi:hypothetical protein
MKYIIVYLSERFLDECEWMRCCDAEVRCCAMVARSMVKVKMERDKLQCNVRYEIEQDGIEVGCNAMRGTR